MKNLTVGKPDLGQPTLGQTEVVNEILRASITNSLGLIGKILEDGKMKPVQAVALEGMLDSFIKAFNLDA